MLQKPCEERGNFIAILWKTQNFRDMKQLTRDHVGRPLASLTYNAVALDSEEVDSSRCPQGEGSFWGCFPVAVIACSRRQCGRVVCAEARLGDNHGFSSQ